MIGTHYKWLLILGVITSAVGAYYYLRVVIAMYFKDEETQVPVAIQKSNTFVIVATTVLTIVIGVMPGIVAEMFRF
jgi:NADH-quinone oxidoreductase subunit N